MARPSATEYGSFHQTYINYTSGKDYSILEVAEMFGGKIKFIEARPGDRKMGLANTEETKQKLGWTPKMSLETWIKNIILKQNND